MDEVQRLNHLISGLERRLSMMIRHGVIHDVKPGQVMINWGDKSKQSGDPGGADDSTGAGAGGDSTSDPWLSPWIRASQHNGVVTENYPWKKGQTVTSVGMDPDHLTALVFPHSWSDQNPQDKDASNDAHTLRIRKQPDSGSSDQSGGSGSGDDQDSQGQAAQDDDDNDVRISHTYQTVDVRIGSKMTWTFDREAKKITVVNDKSQHVLEPDQITTKVGDEISHVMTLTQHILSAGGGVEHVISEAGQLLKTVVHLGA